MNKKTITLLVGLPGSGKSYWLNNFAISKNSRIFDDVSQTDPQLKKLHTALMDETIKNIYIADVNFLQQGIIEKAQEKIINLSNNIINFQYIIFLSTKEISTKNVELRQDGRIVSGTIDRFHKNVQLIENKYRNNDNAQFVIVEDYTKKEKNNNFKI